MNGQHSFDTIPDLENQGNNTLKKKENEITQSTETIPVSSEDLGKNIEDIETKIGDLNKSKDSVADEIQELRKEMIGDSAIPPLDEDPHSIRVAKDKVSELENKHQEYSSHQEKLKKENISPVVEAKLALDKMPEGKQGIVLGVGDNTKLWASKGWKTLDIDPATGADMITDVNYLENVAKAHSQDFLFAEAIKFDPHGKDGAAHARLLQQANKALKMDGSFIIKTASFENYNDPSITVPEKNSFLELLTKHGFETVVEAGEPHRRDGNKMVQEITYYAKKTGEGFDPERTIKVVVERPPLEKEIANPESIKDQEKPTDPEDVKGWTDKTFYERLGISKTATEEEVSKAFRTLSKKYHPDTVSGDETLRANYEEVQKLIAEAAITLGNSSDRAKYDSKNPSLETVFQQESKPKYPFQEKENTPRPQEAVTPEVRDFVEYLNRPEQSLLFDVENIKQRMDGLAALGVSREKIREFVEPVVFRNFENVMKNKMLFDMFENHVVDIKNQIKTYEKLGVSQDRLINSAETLVIDSLVKDLNNGKMFLTPPDKIKQKINSKVNALNGLGFNKDKIMKVLESNGFDN